MRTDLLKFAKVSFRTHIFVWASQPNPDTKSRSIKIPFKGDCVTQSKVPFQIIESAELASERGWKATFYLKNGDVHKRVFITAHDWDYPAVVIERVGERHKEPTLVLLQDVARVEVHWN